ncbi:XK-related protein [Trinorchestia longiramus]|nr:XK-related protein [Trinorchestia longiramus]
MKVDVSWRMLGNNDGYWGRSQHGGEKRQSHLHKQVPTVPLSCDTFFSLLPGNSAEFFSLLPGNSAEFFSLLPGNSAEFFSLLPGNSAEFFSLLPGNSAQFFSLLPGNSAEFFSLLPGNSAEFFSLLPGNSAEFFSLLPGNSAEFFSLSPGNSGEFFSLLPGNSAEFFSLLPGNSAEFFSLLPGNSAEFFSLLPGNSAEFFSLLPGNSAEFFSLLPGNSAQFFSLLPGNSAQFFSLLPGNSAEFFSLLTGNSAQFFSLLPGNSAEFFSLLPGNSAEFFSLLPGNSVEFFSLLPGNIAQITIHLSRGAEAMATEFLPLCDVLFNIISLASYFCDVVFDCVTIYTLYEARTPQWFYATLSCVLGSLLLCQICSLTWHLDSSRRGKRTRSWLLAAQHLLLGGVLVRYFILFLPVDLRHVKHEVRDLCVLRMLHGFCQAAPMLLLQLFLIWQKPSAAAMTDLNIVSTALSLFSVCWALASFNKNVRSHNVHRLVLTWLGVICQLAWRLGTVTSRCLALTVYATVYGFWVLLVITLHWVSMFLWLISPRNVFHGEKMPMLKKVCFSMLIAFCYIFCYINLQEVNSRRKMTAFYLTMLLENTLLVSVWLGGLRVQPWYQHSVTAVTFLSFGLGILFMLLYYRHFHVRKLKQNYSGPATTAVYHCTGCRMDECMDKSHRMPFPYYLNELSASDNSTLAADNRTTKINNTCQRPFSNASRLQFVHHDTLHVPGVFNCRFNPAIKRKKKKPTSFVPPPASVAVSLNLPNNVVSKSGRLPPFWKQPASLASSDHEGSVGSRVNIQQKLQEKKQQQIAELHQIEEEIRTGKLTRPHPSDMSESGTLPQPIPKEKKQPWVGPDPIRCTYLHDTDENHVMSSVPRKNRSQTPEILLAPHYLENSRIYYEYQDPRWKYGNNYHLPSDEMSNSSFSKRSTPRRNNNTPEKFLDHKGREKVIYKSVRASSDLDSQISLPRSYTLPREFKFYRRPKTRKTIRSDHFLTSTNSSDGDVDSCDEGDALAVHAAPCLNGGRLQQHRLHGPFTNIINNKCSNHHNNQRGEGRAASDSRSTRVLLHSNKPLQAPSVPPGPDCICTLALVGLGVSPLGCPPTRLSTHQTVHPPDSPPTRFSTHQTLHPPDCSPTRLSTHQTLHPPDSPPTRLSTHQTVYPPDCPPTRLSTHQTVHPPDSPPTRLSTHQTVHPPDSPPTRLSTHEIVHPRDCPGPTSLTASPAAVPAGCCCDQQLLLGENSVPGGPADSPLFDANFFASYFNAGELKT